MVLAVIIFTITSKNASFPKKSVENHMSRITPLPKLYKKNRPPLPGRLATMAADEMKFFVAPRPSQTY
jgi:hypothetical protein